MCAIVALSALVAPAAAQAAGSSALVHDGVLIYTAAPGAANDLTVTSSGTTARLTDTGPGVTVTTGPGCSHAGSTVVCTGVYTLSLNVGDGDNTVDSTGAALPTGVLSGAGADIVSTGPRSDAISTGGGNDYLDGGGGSDYLNGGSGDDVFAARDGSVDALTCGTGNDSGFADPTDSLSSDCEAVDTGTTTSATPPGGTTSGGGGGQTGTTAPGTGSGGTGIGDPSGSFALTGPINILPPVVPAQTAAVTRRGVALVKVFCPLDAGRCRGVVDLYLPVPAAAPGRGKVVAARRRRMLKVGRAKFTAQAGQKLIVPVRLNRRGRRRILRHRKTVVLMKVTTRGASGKRHVVGRTIALRPRRTAPHARRR